MASRPVFVLGAGAIVRDAHLPAYARRGIAVGGVFDLDRARAEAAATLARTTAFDSLEALVDGARAVDGVFDLALPPAAVAPTLAALPERSWVLVQKPFGRDLAEATGLRRALAARGMRGAVNFQLRHAPAIVALRALVASGAIGEPVDLELRVVCRMPWETWPFLRGMPRMEVLMHAIHYLDLARALFGEPDRVWCATARDPRAPELAETRSTTAMTFGDARRAVVTTYHHHEAPAAHDASHLRIEGTRGTAVARLGVNLDYPTGRPDTLEWSADGGPWRTVPLEGNWFPDAFGGAMAALLDAADRDAASPRDSGFDDAWRTMALVETCYKSAAAGETPPPPPMDT
jgi:predicted dehydrogenase